MKTQNKMQRIGIILIAILLGVGVPEYINSTNTEVITNDNVSESESKLDAVKFIRCVDGDTIIVDDGTSENKRVRMIGIDTPSGNKLYAAAREYGLDDFSFELFFDFAPIYFK